MKITFLIIVALHGAIHLLGFLKAFSIADIKELTMPISKPMGIVWFSVFLLFLLLLLAYYTNNKYWWLLGFLSILCSQILIFYFWKDAKFGSIANILILVPCIIGFFQYNFDRQLSQEIKAIRSNALIKAEILEESMIKDLPFPVKNWLKNSGAVGKPIIHNVELQQRFLLKLKPEQESWYEGEAIQYFNTQEPSFLWTIDLQIMNFISVKGRDKFAQGNGEMLIKLFSMIPVVDAKNNSKIDQGTMQRYLGEIVWMPSAALSPYIEWEAIDDYSAKATMTYKNTSASGVFTFNNQGDIEKYSAMRYMGGEENSELREWVIDIQKIDTFHGIKIPSASKATWKLDEMDWNWAQIEIEKIDYNIDF